MFFGAIYKANPRSLLSVLIVKPQTVVRWHRGGFQFFWRFKCRGVVGRQKISAENRRLIREMSRDNPLWGVSRIHGELLKLGTDVAQSTVAKIWWSGEDRHLRPGGRSSTIMPIALPLSIDS
jgi:hypothetical protein